MKHKATLALLGAAFVTTLALGVSGAASGATPGSGFVPSHATPAELAAADPLEPLLTGLSAKEPSICRDLTEPRREQAPNTANLGAITVSPASTEMSDLEAGTTYSHCLVVHNRQSDRHEFELTTLDVTGSPDPDQQQMIVDPPQALGQWIHPALTSFALDPGERIFIPYVIAAPQALPSGTLTGGIRVTELPPKSEVSGAIIQPSIVHRLYVTLPGGASARLAVDHARAPHLVSHNDDPTVYRARFVVSNQGTILDSYDSKLDVNGLFGRGVARVTVPSATILPGGSQRVELVWRDLPWIGIYTPKARLVTRSGTVTVELPRLLVLPSTPWLIAIALAVLLPLIALVVRWRRRRAEWQQYIDMDDDSDDEFDVDAGLHDVDPSWR